MLSQLIIYLVLLPHREDRGTRDISSAYLREKRVERAVRAEREDMLRVRRVGKKMKNNRGGGRATDDS